MRQNEYMIIYSIIVDVIEVVSIKLKLSFVRTVGAFSQLTAKQTVKLRLRVSFYHPN